MLPTDFQNLKLSKLKVKKYWTTIYLKENPLYTELFHELII